jgi:hypothetical protein
MRTFSLIWSGIGCFATVAITVLGGVILAGGGNARAEEEGGTFFRVTVYVNRLYTETTAYYHSQVSGFSLSREIDSVETSIPDDIHSEGGASASTNHRNYSSYYDYYMCGSPPFSGSITLKDGYKFANYSSTYSSGSYDVSFKNNYRTIYITASGSGNRLVYSYAIAIDASLSFPFTLYINSSPCDYAMSLSLLITESYDYTVSSHISMDE